MQTQRQSTTLGSPSQRGNAQPTQLQDEMFGR